MKWQMLDNDEISILRESIGFCERPKALQTTILGPPYYHFSAEESRQLASADKRLRDAQDYLKDLLDVYLKGWSSTKTERAPIKFTEAELMALSKATLNYYQWLGRTGLRKTGHLEGYAPVKRVLVQSTIKKLMGWRGWVPRGLWRLISRIKAARSPKLV